MTLDEIGIPRDAQSYVRGWPVAVGSRVTCDPPPMDTDEDYLLEFRYYGDVEPFEKAMEAAGWTVEGRRKSAVPQSLFDALTAIEPFEDEYHMENFRSFRKGNLNVIAAYRQEFHSKFLLATEVCKQLNLQDKKQRIMLFRAILYGETP